MIKVIGETKLTIKLKMIVLALSVSFFLTACHRTPTVQPETIKPVTYSAVMKQKMDEYGDSSRKQLSPYFAKADLPYPPKYLTFLVFKNTRRLEIWSKANPEDPWKYVRRFHILAASGGPGPKLHEGDRQVPEGLYQITSLNPRSRFDLSMHLNYPNSFDRAEAKQSGRNNLGGDIFIHGNKLSIGCIALGNHTIEELFPMVYETGLPHINVVIAPNDFRKSPPIITENDPKWVPDLYKQIAVALKDYKVSRPIKNQKKSFMPTFLAKIFFKNNEKKATAINVIQAENKKEVGRDDLGKET